MRIISKNLSSSILIGIITFLLAILVTLSSQTRVQYVSLASALIILFLIILIGVLADMIGVSATVAQEKSFNAKATRKIFGAKQGLFLVKHGDKVASFMCDIIGDICGTVSGAIGAVIVIKIINNWLYSATIVNLVLIGLISALTVSGKSYCKTYGIKKADEIIFFVGKIIASFTLLKDFFKGKLRGDK